jgi:hypothetical protein
MGISISPDSWIPGLFKNNKERHVKTADYLDQIAEEAMSLAKIWENVARSIMQDGSAEAEGNTVWIRLVERPEWTIYSKSIPRSRLELFYDRVANILGNNNKGEDFVICKIGSILQKRKLTQDIIEEDLKRLKDARYFDKANQVNRALTLPESITLLNKEVAALSSFAKEFRTKI